MLATRVVSIGSKCTSDYAGPQLPYTATPCKDGKACGTAACSSSVAQDGSVSRACIPCIILKPIAAVFVVTTLAVVDMKHSVSSNIRPITLISTAWTALPHDWQRPAVVIHLRLVEEVEMLPISFFR